MVHIQRSSATSNAAHGPEPEKKVIFKVGPERCKTLSPSSNFPSLLYSLLPGIKEDWWGGGGGWRVGGDRSRRQMDK